MHARITTARVRPGAAAAVEAGWRSLLEPYRASGAFCGMLALHAPQEDVAVTLSLWASDAAADEAAASLRPLALAAFADLLLQPVTIEPYDVLLVELA